VALAEIAEQKQRVADYATLPPVKCNATALLHRQCLARNMPTVIATLAELGYPI
jgi:hypothetical protein